VVGAVRPVRVRKMRLIEELEESRIPHYVDCRGTVADLGCFNIESLHVVEMKIGAVRGNHAHGRDEIICVIGAGAHCEIVAESQYSRKRQHLTVDGNLKTYRIKAGIKHVIKNSGKITFHLVCFYDGFCTARLVP